MVFLYLLFSFDYSECITKNKYFLAKLLLKKKKRKRYLPLLLILTGEHPAAMQHGGQLKLANLPFVMISTTLLTFLNHPY